MCRSKAPSFDHVIGTGEHCSWDGKAKLLGSLKIDDEIELGWLLDGRVRRFRVAQTLVDIVTGATETGLRSSPLYHRVHDFGRPQLSYASGSASGDVSGNSLISRTSTFSPARYR
jgi:hypothetical protein